MSSSVKIRSGFEVGGGGPLFLIAGPCVAESLDLCMKVGNAVARIAERLKVPYVFKTSYDKANRSSMKSYRGPGLDQGLKILERVGAETGAPLLTDIHSIAEARAAAPVVDILQIPAFLCRQTDLILGAASTGRVVNLKKGQFVAPWDFGNAVEKARSGGAKGILLTERGTSFGYNQLVVDMRSIPIMQGTGCPVVMDVTHAVQEPGGLGHATGGRRDMIPVIAAAAVAAGADGVFLEVHPDPDKALCDGPNSIALRDVEALLARLVAIRAAATGAR